MNIAITKITASNLVGKTASLSDGAVRFTPSAQLVEGTIEVIEIESLQELANLQNELRGNQICVYGVPIDPTKTQLTTKARIATAGANALTRSRDDFKWSDGPGILLLDYDPPKDGSATLSPAALVNTLRAAVPELCNVDILSRPSASSHIWDRDTQT